MDRRQFLAAIAGTGGVLAGCSADAEPTPTDTPSDDSPSTVARGDVELPVPEAEMTQAVPRDSIAAVVNPAFGDDWTGLAADGVAETALPGSAPVIGLARDGTSRAYPLRILNRHEVVNDQLGGPLAITYCPICGSGVVVERIVEGEPTLFGVSGKLWRSDLVMYDEATESLWSQLLATAIRGSQTGEQLRLVPSTLTTWAEWQKTEPETEIQLPPSASDLIAKTDQSFDYFSSWYDYENESQLVGHDSFDGGLHPRTMVVGISSDAVKRAYPFPVVTDAGIVEDRVGTLPVVVTIANDGTLVAYDRRVGGEPLSFDTVDDRFMAAGDSRWRRSTGVAVDGPHAETELVRANDHPPMFWRGWSNFNPEADVYGIAVDAD
jgi:hypothetical protein